MKPRTWHFLCVSSFKLLVGICVVPNKTSVFLPSLSPTWHYLIKGYVQLILSHWMSSDDRTDLSHYISQPISRCSFQWACPIRSFSSSYSPCLRWFISPHFVVSPLFWFLALYSTFEGTICFLRQRSLKVILSTYQTCRVSILPPLHFRPQRTSSSFLRRVTTRSYLNIVTMELYARFCQFQAQHVFGWTRIVMGLCRHDCSCNVVNLAWFVHNNG